ncbi:MAG TPA: hypothetical protein VF384_20235 [Planctomycetota bacterium]
MHRWLMVVVVAALMIAAAWWLRTDEPSAPPQAARPAVPGVAQAPERAAPTDVSMARDEAPPAAVPPPVELDRDEIDAMRRWPGPGELEALVVQGAQPLAGVRVRVWPRGPGRLGSAGERGPATVEGRTDARGRVLFTSMAVGEFVVRADHEGRYLEADGAVSAGTDRPPNARTVVILFGTASITGSVRNDTGAPRAGVPVHIVRLGQMCTVVAVTDRAGAFEFGGLFAGCYWVQLEEPEGQWSALNDRMLTLQPGERAHMDFGGPTPAGSLHGRVVDAEGNAVRGFRELRLRHVVHNDERRVRTELDGTFSIALPPGRWQLLEGSWWATDVLATVDIGTAIVRAEVTWPGIRLLAVVSATPDVDLQDLGQYLWLNTPDSRADTAFTEGGQSFVQWTGLAPGEYQMQAQGGFQFVDAPPAGVLVRLTDARVQRVFVNVRRGP